MSVTQITLSDTPPAGPSLEAEAAEQVKAEETAVAEATKAGDEAATAGLEDEAEETVEETVTPPAVLVTADEMNAYSKEVTEKGELSKESLAALEAKKIPPELAIRFVKGQLAIAAQEKQELFAAAGGEQNYKAAQTWANTALSKEDKAAFNEAVNSGDMAKAKLAVTGLYSKYTTEHGSNPTRVAGKSGGGPKPFTSSAQLVEAISNPKYDSDPAYRAAVAKRLAVSKI
jgi:hypothetical protein